MADSIFSISLLLPGPKIMHCSGSIHACILTNHNVYSDVKAVWQALVRIPEIKPTSEFEGHSLTKTILFARLYIQCFRDIFLFVCALARVW